MFNVGWIYVIIQLACIAYLIHILPILNWSVASMIQLPICILGLWAVYESRKARMGILPKVLAHSTLIDSGPYKLLRHPMYSSILLFFIVGILFYPSQDGAICYIILLCNLLLKLRYEEKLLLKQYPDYKSYMKHTYRLIPYVY